MSFNIETLADKLRDQAKKQGQIDGNAVNWDRVRDDWLQRVEHLLDQVVGWTQTLQDEGLLSIKREAYVVNEERLGEYTSSKLTLTTPTGFPIEVSPFHRVIRGAVGRVDVSSPAERFMLLRNQEDDWSIVWQLTPSPKHEVLSEESFVKLLDYLIG